MPAQMHPAHSPGLVEMRVGPFEQFAPLPQQPLSTGASNPPAIGVDRVTGRRVTLPVAAPAIRLRDVTADADGGERDHRLVTVIPLVPNHVGEASTGRQDRFHVGGGGDERLDQCRRVPVVGVLHRDAHDGARLQVHRMLRGVRQVRASVLHLRDFRVRILGVRPVVVGPFLLALPVEPGQFSPRRCGDTGCRREPRQPGLVRLARVPAHDAPQRGVGFQGGRIDPEGPAFHQLGVGQPLQHPRKHRLVRLQVDQAPGARHGRMVRRRLVQLETQEVTNAQRVGGAPRDGALRVQAFKVAEQQQPEIAPRRQTRAPDAVGIELRARRLDEAVEVRVVEHAIQLLVKRVARAPRQIRGGHPHVRLPRAAAPFAHRHARKCSTRDRSCRSLMWTFTTGC